MMLWLAYAYAADPTLVPIRLDVDASSLSSTDVDDLIEQTSGLVGPTERAVPMVRDASGAWTPVHTLLPAPPPVPDKEPWAARTPISMPADFPGETSGWLDGREVYLSQCHGWIWFDSLGRFSTQRGILWDTVEDIHNPEGLDQYLSRYLENAGAAVFTVKERDLNPNRAVADNDGEGYSESGSGFAQGAAGYIDEGPWSYGENPFGTGTTRTFPANGGAVATWMPEVPEDGRYAVYVAWDSDAKNATDAHYRITHPGGVIDRRFDQTVHGSTWQYVDTLWLTAGLSLTIELVGDSAQAGKLLSADAVRIGGGVGDIVRNGETTGRPRWEEGGILGSQDNGAPTSVYDPYSERDGSDPSSRSRWAAWEHPSGKDALYLSWHSNAATGTARGTVTYSYDSGCTSGAAVAGSADLSRSVQDAMIDSITTFWDPDWFDRGTKTECFSEVNPANNPEMPAALVELAFHDNEEDAWYLVQPRFRDDMSRAMYHGIVRYFADRDGLEPVFLPEPPEAVAVTHADGGLVVSWAAGPAGEPFGDVAQDYLVQTSKDGLAWDNGRPATGTSLALDVPKGSAVYVRVVARNDGGVSFPSEVVGARRSADGEVPILLVTAFDRLDSGLLSYDDLPGVGTSYKMTLENVNPQDVAAVHGRAIDALGWPFDSVSDEAFADIDVSRYKLVVWMAGEESTSDESFSSAQQLKLRGFVDDGGALWASGAEILWDLDYKGNAADKAFAAEVLGATMASDAADTYTADGADVLSGLRVRFGVDDGAPYPVEWADVLATSRTPILTYSSGGVAAALGDRVALFGFPFETIGDPSVRDQVVERLLPALLPGYTPGTEPDDTDVPDDTDAPVDSGNAADPDATGPWSRVALGDLGCGCATGGTSLAPLAPLLAALLLRRRR